MTDEVQHILVYRDILYSCRSNYELVIGSFHDHQQAGLELERDIPVLTTLPSHFSHEILIVDSIQSGTGRVGDRDIYTRLIQPLFESLQIGYTYKKTEHLDSVSEFARSSLHGDDDYFVVFISGDTSIGEFINGLVPGGEEEKRTELVIGNVAAGTGNALLASLRVSGVAASVSNLFWGSSVELPLHEVVFRNCDAMVTVQDQEVRPVQRAFFVAVFSWAFHAALVADSDTPELRQLGIARFGIAARRNLESLQEYTGVIELDSQEELQEQRHSYLVLTALSNFEPTFEISPAANLRDLYLVEVGSAVQGAELMSVMALAYKKGAHVNDERVVYRKVQNVKLKLKVEEEKKLRFCLDGSIIKVKKIGEGDIEIEVQKAKVAGWDIKLIKR